MGVCIIVWMCACGLIGRLFFGLLHEQHMSEDSTSGTEHGHDIRGLLMFFLLFELKMIAMEGQERLRNVLLAIMPH